jgi:hypothetical protein
MVRQSGGRQPGWQEAAWLSSPAPDDVARRQTRRLTDSGPSPVATTSTRQRSCQVSNG